MDADREQTWRDELAELRWRIKHGGGDEIADANCWRASKPFLSALLAELEQADATIELLTEQRDKAQRERDEDVEQAERDADAQADELAAELAKARTEATQAERDKEEAIRRLAQLSGVDTRPIPEADLEHAKQYVREQGWVE